MSEKKLKLDSKDYEDIDIDDPDNPEWTAEDFATARPLSEVMPEMYEKLTGKTPQKPSIKAAE